MTAAQRAKREFYSQELERLKNQVSYLTCQLTESSGAEEFKKYITNSIKEIQ